MTDITGWTPSQLGALPHFDRYVAVAPVGASLDFAPVCANGLGLTAGTRGETGAFVAASAQADIPAWGTFHWSYWTWDGSDYHYYFGSVTHSPPRALDALGRIVGYATLSGSGDSSLDYDAHAYLHDSATGKTTDLTPAAHRADPRDMNDLGEITGYWSGESSYHPFRRSPEGTVIDFVYDEPFSHSIAPMVINNRGHVVGLVTVWTTPRDYIPFFSESGSNTGALPYPDADNRYSAGIADINDHDVIVGHYFKAVSPLETTAVRWTRIAGAWHCEELIELLVDNLDFILDRAIAVNDAGHIICTGHSDGGPNNAFNTHTFLLTPLSFPAPAVTSLPPADVSSTGATLRAKINAVGLPTDSWFQYGSDTEYGTDFLIEPIGGTLPYLAQRTLTDLLPHTTYHFRATATNGGGSTDGADLSFTTPWDWTSWAGAHLGATTPGGDANRNGLPDAIDYATGNADLPSIVLEEDRMEFTFRRSLVADGVTVVVQVSEDLVTWIDGSSYSLSGSIPDSTVTTELFRTSDGPEAEWVTLRIAAQFPVRFVRLQAGMP